MPDTKDDGSGEKRVFNIPIREPASRADFNNWARRDLWHMKEAAMLILGFAPVDVKEHWWPPDFEDSLKDIVESMHRSIEADRLLEWSNPREFLAWAREKEYPIPEELEEAVSRFHPMDVVQTPPATREKGVTIPDEVRPSTTIAPDTARRKAPDTFVAALIRLIVEISKRAAERGMPFDVTAMPGTKSDFRALAEKFDDYLEKSPSTFNDYLAGLLRFKQGARETAFYRELFPEFFRAPRPNP